MNILIKLIFVLNLKILTQIPIPAIGLCADGTASSACNICTNGICSCPSSQRNGMTCSQASDVNYCQIFI